MADVDATGPVWVYKVAQHKTAHHGRDRLVPLGPKAVAVVKEFAPDDPADFVFSPTRGREERYDRIRAARKTRVQPSQIDRRKRVAKKLPGRCYIPTSLAAAVRLGVDKANEADEKPPIPRWSPGQLRHTFATLVRKQFGIEAAGAVLGHSRLSVTEVYAERDHTLAAEVASKVG